MGRHARFAFEDPVEIGHVVETAAVGDFGDGHIGVDQHTRHVSQTDFGARVDETLAGSLFDVAAA